MKILVSAIIVVISSTLALQAQPPSDNTCPKLWIKTPDPGAYFQYGETYEVLAAFTRFPKQEVKYKWKFPEGKAFKGQGTHQLTFVADEKIGSVDVEVSVEGLPSHCPTTASASFQVMFNPGSPLVLDEFGFLNAREESERIGPTVSEISRRPGMRALFVLTFLPTDRKRDLRRRVDRLSSVLTRRYRLPNDRFTFVFSESGVRGTTIYAWGIDAPLNDYWAADIDKLKIRN